MNNRRKTNRTKKQRGIKIYKDFLRPMKKVRGKFNKRNTAIKIHSVSNTEIILSTSFAIYKIPLFHFATFKKANQRIIQNVTGYFVRTSRFDVNTRQYEDNPCYMLQFYWHELNDMLDIDNFAKFKVADKDCPSGKRMFRKGIKVVVQ